MNASFNISDGCIEKNPNFIQALSSLPTGVYPTPSIFKDKTIAIAIIANNGDIFKSNR